MDLKKVALIVAANLLAIAVGLQRLDTQGFIRLDSFLPYQLLGQPCGLSRDTVYAIVSDRIVLPTGLAPGAGMLELLQVSTWSEDSPKSIWNLLQ